MVLQQIHQTFIEEKNPKKKTEDISFFFCRNLTSATLRKTEFLNGITIHMQK